MALNQRQSCNHSLSWAIHRPVNQEIAGADLTFVNQEAIVPGGNEFVGPSNQSHIASLCDPGLENDANQQVSVASIPSDSAILVEG